MHLINVAKSLHPATRVRGLEQSPLFFCASKQDPYNKTPFHWSLTFDTLFNNTMISKCF